MMFPFVAAVVSFREASDRGGREEHLKDVDGENGECQTQRRPDDVHGILAKIAACRPDHLPPRGLRRHDTQTEEAQSGFKKDRSCDCQRGLDDQR